MALFIPLLVCLVLTFIYVYVFCRFAALQDIECIYITLFNYQMLKFC